MRESLCLSYIMEKMIKCSVLIYVLGGVWVCMRMCVDVEVDVNFVFMSVCEFV